MTPTDGHLDGSGFVVAILAGDLDAVGPFADWLDEHDDPRGVLLRRRWKRWRTDRAGPARRERQTRATPEKPLRATDALAEGVRATGGTADVSWVLTHLDAERERIDDRLREYVRERFPLPEAVA